MNFNKTFRYITDRPFLMALIVFVVLFLGYNYFKKKSPAATVVAQQAVPTYGRPVIYNQEFTQYPTSMPPTPAPPPPPPTPAPEWPKTGTVRKSTGSTWDNQYGGVYIFATPATAAGGGRGVSTVPFGSTIQLLGKVTGAPYGGPTGGGSNVYYQVAGGYINSQDVAVASGRGGFRLFF